MSPPLSLCSLLSSCMCVIVLSVWLYRSCWRDHPHWPILITGVWLGWQPIHCLTCLLCKEDRVVHQQAVADSTLWLVRQLRCWWWRGKTDYKSVGIELREEKEHTMLESLYVMGVLASLTMPVWVKTQVSWQETKGGEMVLTLGYRARHHSEQSKGESWCSHHLSGGVNRGPPCCCSCGLWLLWLAMLRGKQQGREGKGRGKSCGNERVWIWTWMASGTLTFTRHKLSSVQPLVPSTFFCLSQFYIGIA